MSGAADLSLVECPAFARLDRASIAFAFELDPGGERDGDVAFRVSALHDAIFGAHPKLAEPHLDRAKALFNASTSFLDDITTGIPGVNGRPMLLAATTQSPADEGRRCTIRRPAEWQYEYEGTIVGLGVPQARRNLAAVLQDHFCIFESGRIFYVLGFAHADATDCPFDEYSLIHMLQLVRRQSESADADYLAFSHANLHLSLIDFAKARLAEIDRVGEGKKQGFALGDVLRPFGILPSAPSSFTLTAPCNAMVQVEDPAMFSVARYTLGHYRIDNETPETIRASAFAPRDEVAAEDEHPKELWALHNIWQAQGCALQDDARLLHDVEGFGEADDYTPIPRHVLAFAGLAQRVPDFPRQDDSEVHDSTRPVSIALENLFYVHPAFEFEVGINWRTFKQGQENIGACPYALLTWLIVVHDEILVTEMENLIQDMLFAQPDRQAPLAQLGRTVPAQRMGQLLDKVASLRPATDCSLDDNLRDRLRIFRRCTIHQSGNVFRYPTERGLLDDVRDARGTRARFDDALALIDRYENLAEDVASLQAGYAANRANMLLALLSLLGAIALPKTIIDLAAELGHPMAVEFAIWSTLGIIALAIAAYWAIQLSRSRNSS